MKTLLTQAVEQWATDTPDQPAFRFAGSSLDYGQLWQRAEQLAWVLMDNGVRRGDRVAIFMDKCLETAIAVYGIMRAGAAFVPIDASAPEARIRHMMTHCGIKIMVSHPSKANALSDMFGNDNSLDCVIGIEASNDSYTSVSWQTVYAISETAPQVALDEHDLAYIMYTSGSTGRPKGIMHSHFSGLSYARMAADTYGLKSTDRLGNHSPLHFDMSTLDYLAGPLVGATTVIIPEAYTKLPASLSQLIETEKLTIWYSVPYALILLLQHGVLDKRDASSIRWVLFGGEPFQPKHLFSLMKHWPQARFSNVYGPAEVNQCTYYHIPNHLADDQSIAECPIPIGQTWAGVDSLIINADDQQVPDGEVGELLIHAPTMMQGYWDQETLNAAAFYDHPLTDGRSQRFYRTGDMVKRNTAGLLEFVGRKDRQVKIRGYRVELDEIESVLATHPDVVETCAYPVEGSDGSLRLEAAVITGESSEIGTSELRDFIAQRLSIYALPATLHISPSFPRTTSGKIDRLTMQENASQRTECSAVV